ncbi:uncharacterized protein Z520_02606 [Fonsecaea multimorphosa CBS 102226]|uniref:RBR-type E3 ubiquitin transferase n=1 Tax=Fonsecaea multimorphosa CBS 102226 TaxID=1442371 RepID=A0A0D2IZI7_9EURO|nr:uncharacterized protein Z520_02606 [Fonsecaea multimorphosa CBS 102226]KIY02467.1 hypothetical protein Z520_02606 [Fonsecaea multimorphosa CBS 102226]OAL29106.1 hypothetical protein AYO22_02543 [Fonsecaea multimorphosa]
MLAHKSARIRQLSGGLFVEEPPPQRIGLQPRFRVETISQHDKAFAESVLKKEASAARGSKPLLRRVKSKLSRPDKAVTLAVLYNHVQANGSAEVAQVYVDRLFLDAAQSNLQLQFPDILFCTAVKNANTNLVRLLAPLTAIEAVSSVLESAILSRNLQIVRALLEHGADPNCLTQACILDLAETDCQLLQLILRAPRQLRYETFGELCATTIRQGLSNAFNVVLRAISEYPILRDSPPSWNRDSLLEAAICGPDKSMFFGIATATSAWPLRDNRLFLHVLDSTAIDRLQAKDMVEVLLCLSVLSPVFHSSPEIESFHCRCVQEQLEDILRLMASYGVAVSAEPLLLACQNHDEKILDVLLAGPVQGEEQVVARVSQLQGVIQRDMRRKILRRLLAGGAKGVWKHEELVTAVALGQVEWVETLINSNASVDYHNGAALLKAVSLGHVRIVQKLLSRPVSLKSLQDAFPSISQLEALPRRLLTKLFINQGLSGQCLDDALNRELCNYSYHRDSELVDMLITSGASCNDVSLTVVFEHKDAVIFDKIRLSKTVFHESVTEWFKNWHRMLLLHAQQEDEYSLAASTCLKMLFSKLHIVEALCDAHEGDRRFECFHQFLENGAADTDILAAWLKWALQMDSNTLTEIVLTAACFCDLSRLHLVISSIQLTSPTPLPSATYVESPKLDSQAHTANMFSSVQVPPIRQDTLAFSDTRSAENLKLIFRQYLHGGYESHLTTKLLERHLENCTKAITEGECWPLLTLQFLLSQPIEVTLPEFSSCLYMAIASQQWLVLGLLLDRQLPQEMVARFFLVDTSLLAPRAIKVLLESQAMAWMDDDFFAGPVQRTFNHACLAQDREMAILLCSKSRCQLRLGDILLPVRQAIDASDLSYVSTLLGATSFSKNDLEILWKHITQQDQSADFLALVELLLKAGADGISIGASLVEAVERDNECLVALILAQWQAIRSLQYRNEFDYRGRQPIFRTPDFGPYAEYFPVLARALTVAIRLDRATLCRHLCTAGAPLVFQGQSLIELAVALGSHSALIEMISYSKTCSDMDGAVSFALLQVVLHHRETWVEGLVRLGGSVEAYDFEPLKVAAEFDHPGMLATLLPYIETQPGFHEFCQTLQGRLTAHEGDLGSTCSMFEQLHKAGFQEKERYNEALLTLLAIRSATLDHTRILIDCGASIEYRDGEGMVQLWRRGSVRLFPDLLRHCTRQSIRTRLFIEACGDYLRQDQDRTCLSTSDTLLVLGALLETDIPQDARDTALDSIAKACHRKLKSGPIIQLLLEKGARFFDRAGVSLYRVCRLDHSKITSLVVHSRPHARTRLQALQRLFRNQGAGSSGAAGRETGQEPNPSDQACLYNINFTASTAQNINLDASDVVELIDSMLNPRVQTTGTSLMFTFFFMLGGLHVLSTLCCSDGDRNEVEKMFVNAVMNSAAKELDDRTEFLLRVMQIDAPALVGLTGEASGLALEKNSLSRLLLLSLQHKKFGLASTLLDAGADPNATDENGRTALYLATFEKSLDTMRALIANGAEEDDGSLHISTCWQHHEAMQLLLEAGHEPGYCSELFFGATPLEALLGFSHSEAAPDSFGMTLAVLLCDAEVPTSFWKSEPNLLSLALMGFWPYQMFSTLLWYIPPGVVELPLIRRDRFMFSVLSFVERGEDIGLSDIERVELSTRLESLGFERTFYAAEGDQPEDAVNVPEHLEDPEVRVRLRAWRVKDCAVCAEKPSDRNAIHAALSPSCEKNHGWEDDIICTDCLQGHLESQMFPQGGDKFPSAKVKCWAPNCSEILNHSVVQAFAECERFTIYDAGLAQMFLNDGENMAKCAKPKCTGATWLGDEDKNTTIIMCDVCGESTCIQCNQLYDMHRDEPCPQGEEAKGIERRREEEAATAALLAKGKKCPKCKLPFERIEGCDHIVCGKDAHSSARGLGCGFEFCYICGADYNGIRRQGNTAHARSCNHYA